MDDKVIFLHLYKTGGQTLRNLFTYQTPAAHYFDIGKQRFDDFLALPPDEREEIRMVFGHVKFGMHRCFEQPQRVHYLTMLRNPVERIRSLHRYVNQNTGLDLHRQMPEVERRSLASFVQHIDRYSPYHGNNGMCKSLAGTDRHFPTGNLWDRQIRNEVTEADLLTAALDNLKSKFLLAGLLEYFDESILLYKQVLDWKKPLFYLPRNRSQRPEAPRITPEVLALIQEKNDLDSRLYQEVRKQLLERMAAQRSFLTAERRKLRFNNRMYFYYRKFYRNRVRKVRANN